MLRKVVPGEGLAMALGRWAAFRHHHVVAVAACQVSFRALPNGESRWKVLAHGAAQAASEIGV